jgi:hypothetical protein
MIKNLTRKTKIDDQEIEYSKEEYNISIILILNIHHLTLIFLIDYTPSKEALALCHTKIFNSFELFEIGVTSLENSVRFFFFFYFYSVLNYKQSKYNLVNLQSFINLNLPNLNLNEFFLSYQWNLFL